MLKDENQERELEQRYGIQPHLVPMATTLVDVVLRPHLCRFRLVVAVNDDGGLRPLCSSPHVWRLIAPCLRQPASSASRGWAHVARAAGGTSLRPLRHGQLP
jgi:hypothetical protein